MQTFQVLNVKCGGCAGTLSKELLGEFGKVNINLEVEPREITLNIKNSKKEKLKLKLRKLGYPLVDDDLTTLQTIGTTAKSFISCAIGKINDV